MPLRREILKKLRLLLALAQGATLQEFADQRGVELSTLRSQLKNLFAKTGKTRQSELIRLALMAETGLR